MPAKKRSAQNLIDKTVADNRASEWLLYCLAALFVITGIVILVVGAVRGEAVTSILGVVSSALFVPAVSFARQTRKETIAIRLLEAPLSNAATADEAARLIGQIVTEVLGNQQDK